MPAVHWSVNHAGMTVALGAGLNVESGTHSEPKRAAAAERNR